LSCGLLGILGLEIAAFSHVNDAYFRSLANVQVSNMAECLHFSTKDACLPDWSSKNAEVLPNATSSVKELKSSNKISLCWRANFNHANNCIDLEIAKE
jgi:hypothetical protein